MQSYVLVNLTDDTRESLLKSGFRRLAQLVQGSAQLGNAVVGVRVYDDAVGILHSQCEGNIGNRTDEPRIRTEVVVEIEDLDGDCETA